MSRYSSADNPIDVYTSGVMTVTEKIIAVTQCAVTGLLMALAACGPAYDFVGMWKGSRSLEGVPGADPVIVKTAAMVTVTIDSEGRFSLFESGLPKTGSVAYSGDEARLHVTKIMGQDLERAGAAVPPEIMLKPESSEKIDYVDPSSPGAPVVLTRQTP